jgi:hypothetical protein
MDRLPSLSLPALDFDPVGPLGDDQTGLEPRKKKRPPNAFILFCLEHRSKVQEDHPDKPNVEISRILAEMWKSLDEPSRNPYKLRAQEQQQEFKILVPEYSYVRARQKKMAKKPGEYIPKLNVELPDITTLVNLPIEELRTYVGILQTQLLMSCGESFAPYVTTDGRGFVHSLDDSFSHDIFPTSQ